MFTKNFNTLSDSLIDTVKQTLSKPIINEASNEKPTINHLELSEEELNELSVDTVDSYHSKASQNKSGARPLRGDSIARAYNKIHNERNVKVPAKTPTQLAPMAKEEPELSSKQKKIAQVSHPKDEIDAGDFAKLRAGHKIDEAKRGRKPKGDDEEEGPHYDEREDPETGEITKVKDTVPPKKHIMNQLRQAAQSMKSSHPVTFADGKTHNVSKHVAKALVNAYQDPRKKPYEREDMQTKIGKSHDALMKHHSQMNEDTYNPKLTHKGKMLDELSDAKEEVEQSTDPADKFARDAYGHRAPAVKRLRDGKYHAVNADGEHKIFNNEAAAKKHAHKGIKEEVNEDTYNPKLTHKGKMLDELPVETMKQIRMVNQEEADEEPPFTPDKKKVNWKNSKQSRAKWLAKTAMEKMKNKKMNEEQYAKKVSIPEEVNEESNPLSAFKSKNVRGLYHYNHYEDDHGNFIQAKHDGTNFVYKHKKTGEMKNFDSLNSLKQHLQKLKEEQIDEISSQKASNYISAAKADTSKDRTSGIQLAQKKKWGDSKYGMSEPKVKTTNEEQIDEREMTSDEKAKREKIVMALKKKMSGFKERYGSKAKDVMYATATKQAMKEETPKDGVEINPPMNTKEGIGVKSTTT
jgi:hypothetical protein